MSRRGNGLGFFACLDKFLSVLVSDLFLMFGFHLSLLVTVCLLGIFEDVDEMFSLLMSVCM
jgi:hypothetical protein